MATSSSACFVFRGLYCLYATCSNKQGTTMANTIILGLNSRHVIAGYTDNSDEVNNPDLFQLINRSRNSNSNL